MTLSIQAQTLQLDAFDFEDMSWPEKYLRRPSVVMVTATEITSLRGISVLVASPRDHCFCSFPESVCSAGFGHWRSTASGSYRGWLDQVFTRSGVEKDYLRELKAAGIRPSSIRYGIFPYVGGTADVPKDIGFGKGRPPLWSQWFRNYLIPHNKFDQFVAELRRILNERGVYACRFFADLNIPSDVATHYHEADTRHEALIWSYYSWIGVVAGEHALKVQQRCIDVLRCAVDQAESGLLPDFATLGPAFGEFSARLELADASPQSVGHFNAELIASLRVRLIRLTGWPVFFNLLKSLPDRMALRVRNFPVSQQPLPYDIEEQARGYLHEVLGLYPSYGIESFESLFEG